MVVLPFLPCILIVPGPGSVRNNVPVTGAPSIQRLPLDEWVTVTAEGCLLFACTVMGSPPPPVAWSVNGGRIDLRSSSDLRQMDDGSLKVSADVLCFASPCVRMHVPALLLVRPLQYMYFAVTVSSRACCWPA